MSINRNVIRQITIAMFFFIVLGWIFRLIFIFIIHPEVVLADSAHHGSNIIGLELDIHTWNKFETSYRTFLKNNLFTMSLSFPSTWHTDN
jgi:hypothetical protein